MKYLATVNVPGYSPMAEQPAVFDTTSDAWQYLAEVRENGEDAQDTEEYTATYETLRLYDRTGHGPDTVYGDTPGYDGEHDLGLAYSVTQVERHAGRCVCCGDDVAVMDVGYCCDDCNEAGCEMNPDACGEVAYYNCQRTDSLADTGCLLCRRVGHPMSEECTP